MDRVLENVWTFANSPLGLALFGALVAWLIAKLATAKPAWVAYRGTIINAIRWAEKLIPDQAPDKSLAKLDAALQYVIKVIEEAEKRTVTPAETAVIKDAISLVHDEVYPATAAKGAGPATLAAILDAIKKAAITQNVVVADVFVTLEDGTRVCRQTRSEAIRDLIRSMLVGH
jgi:CheY-like chemotaxis protein